MSQLRQWADLWLMGSWVGLLCCLACVSTHIFTQTPPQERRSHIDTEISNYLHSLHIRKKKEWSLGFLHTKGRGCHPNSSSNEKRVMWLLKMFFTESIYFYHPFVLEIKVGISCTGTQSNTEIITRFYCSLSCHSPWLNLALNKT